MKTTTKYTTAAVEPLTRQFTIEAHRPQLRGPLCASFFKAKQFALVATFAATLFAQAPAPGEPPADPFARLDAAKAAATQDPAGAEHLRRAMSYRGRLGLSADNSFSVINATTDDLGWTHVRLQQYYKGVKVENGQLISHGNDRGEFGDYTNALKMRINIRTEPSLSQEAALAILDRLVDPPSPDRVRKVELVILPVMERYVIATGAPVKPPIPNGDTQPAPEKPATAGDGDLEPTVDPMNAAETARRVVEYRLAYRVRTAQGHEGNGGMLTGTMHHVDANSGEILSERPLQEYATGNGTGKFSGPVTFGTEVLFGLNQMREDYRNFSTFDNDGVTILDSLDADNKWGDGLLFMGDGIATQANRQTAMVDGAFGARVYWDLMNHVFKRKGPNKDFYSVNVFAHAGTNWNNASFSGITGNISLGDGPKRQALDCLGHENGHALNHFTAGLGGSGESGGLNESNSDIWGAMTSFYLKGGSYGSASSTIPSNDGSPSNKASWKSVCSGRDMEKPSRAGQFDYWFSTIGNLPDEHDIAAPSNRAFFFLSQGATAFLKDSTSSTVLPWGMAGLNNQKAARIWYDTVTNYLPGDADYADARSAALLATTLRFGVLSPEFVAVQNAFAAINVGPPAGGSPAAPPVVMEKEPNNSMPSAMALAMPNAPKPAGAPTKLQVIGTGTDPDFYSVQLNAGDSITVRLESGALTDYDLQVFDIFSTQLGVSEKGMGFADQVTIKVPSTGTFFIKVHLHSSKTQVNIYKMYIDFF